MLAAAESISGSSSSPEAVALAPVTSCRYSGTKTIAAKNAQLVSSSAPATTSNTGSRNSRSGRIGSAARRSTAMKAPSIATAAAASPRISAESHAYRVPPQVVTSSTEAIAPASSAAPG